MEQIAPANYGGYARKSAESTPRTGLGDNPAQVGSKTEGENTGKGFAAIAGPIEKLLLSVGVELKFKIHEETGEVQAEVRAADGEKVLREIPPDEQLDLAASIKELSTVFLSRSL